MHLYARAARPRVSSQFSWSWVIVGMPSLTRDNPSAAMVKQGVILSGAWCREEAQHGEQAQAHECRAATSWKVLGCFNILRSSNLIRTKF